MKTHFLSMSSWVVCRSLRLYDCRWTSTGAEGDVLGVPRMIFLVVFQSTGFSFCQFRVGFRVPHHPPNMPEWHDSSTSSTPGCA